MLVRRWTHQAEPPGASDPAVDPAAILTLASDAEAVDGVAPLSEQPLLHLQASASGAVAGVTHLAAVDGSRLVGYAQIDASGGPDGGPASAELIVAPAERRHGVGTALLDGAAEVARSQGRELRVWAHGYVDAARAFATARGLEPVRELWRMSRPLTAADAVPPRLPDGFAVRSFTPEDIDPWVELNALTFATHPEQGRITRADVEQRMSLPWFDPSGFLLVDDTRSATRRLAAYHWTKVEDGVGEVYVVGVHPAYQGLGLGKATTLLGLAHLAGLGLSVVDLYVDGDNAAAVATYRTLGFTRTALDVMLAPRSGGRMEG